MARQNVIIDSDWGGDVLQLASILLSRPDEYEVLGATVTFGNAPLKQNLENAGAILKLLRVDEQVGRFAGAFAPDGVDEQPEGDDAHGRTGLGDVVLEPSEILPSEEDAVDFLLRTVEEEAEGAVTLVATGPQTNVARAILRAPEVMGRLKEIRIMGGCVRDLPGYRVDESLARVGESKIPRRGNITELAEFNFQQAPKDAKTVLESGIPISLFPMDCTHQLTFTERREARFRDALGKWPDCSEKLIGLLNGPKFMDFQKFDCASVMHDLHTTVSMIWPELYSGSRGRVRVCAEGDEAGKTDFFEEAGAPHWVADSIRDPDAVFDVLIESLCELFERRP